MSETLISKLEKGRAEFAYKCAKYGVEQYAKDYPSYVKRVPQMILSNGLGQTLSFIFSKGKNKKNAYDLIYCQIQDYMKSPNQTRIQMPQEKSDLLEWVISCNSNDYRYITEEVLAFFSWLKRFAEGLSEGEANDES